ncbi:MAG: N-carbamoylputrescine amidase [Gammaproteobacteria bacterium]|nr:N-carbamoylputrescine amidase [Gammaproteobacteria bacterium]
MKHHLNVAIVQFAMSSTMQDNINLAKSLVIDAAKNGARLVLLPELFATPYFCKTQKSEYLSLAHEAKNNPILKVFSDIAKQYAVVFAPSVFFERAGQCYFNSLAMIDADGSILDVYRKSHIPDGHGYQEKFYFSPGDTGFKVWKTQVGQVGTAICWDQWFPEAARVMTLMGADILCYPTAIGSEPQDPSIDSKNHWQMVMRGHAAANIIPVMASNRIGRECDDGVCITFYGSSFVSDHQGKKIIESSRDSQSVDHAVLDIDTIRDYRRSWGIFRDRRPDLYQRVGML